MKNPCAAAPVSHPQGFYSLPPWRTVRCNPPPRNDNLRLRPKQFAKTRKKAMATIPFKERVTCTVQAACDHTGFGKTTIFEMIADGTIKSKKTRGRRLIYVPSLIAVVTPEPEQQTAA
jgi:excisionase family DNA binding protein